MIGQTGKRRDEWTNRGERVNKMEAIVWEGMEIR